MWEVHQSRFSSPQDRVQYIADALKDNKYLYKHNEETVSTPLSKYNGLF